MKISTKIVLGYGILIALIAVLVAYEAFAIHRMQTISRNLSRVNFVASLASLRLMRDRDLVEEYTKKYFAINAPEYDSALRDFERELESTLREIRANGRSPGEQDEIARLSRDWRDFKTDLEKARQNLDAGGTPDFPPPLEDRLERLRVQIQAVYRATVAGIESEVARSNETGRRAESMTWMTSILALAVSCLVGAVVVRSISRPLSHLTEGTRRVSDGQFDYRLEASRGDEFSDLARDFNTMTRRLSELDQMKKDFVSHVSHELKAPLVSIRETLKLMLEELPGPLTEKQKRLVEINLNCAQRLSSMIGNLLDLSRMEAGMMEYELRSIDIVPLVRTAVAELEPQSGEMGVSIRTCLPDDPLMAHCDTDRTLQVIGNVVSNAIKYSPHDETIEVRAFEHRGLPPNLPEFWRRALQPAGEDSRFIAVAVADKGVGIPDELKGIIFERFQQGYQAKAAKSQGVGLGLSICRTIMQAHQGAIWVEDNPGGGSIFFMLLPASSGAGTTRGVSDPL
jgi:two-component system sensor histidine kinase GlrK